MTDNDERFWTIEIKGGPAFLTNAAYALELAASEQHPGAKRECLERLHKACMEALRGSPDGEPV